MDSIYKNIDSIIFIIYYIYSKPFVTYLTMSRVICHKSTSWENTQKLPCLVYLLRRVSWRLGDFHVGKVGVYRHAWFIKKDGGRFEFWLPSKQQQVGLLKLRHNLHLWNRYWRREAMQIFRKSSLQNLFAIASCEFVNLHQAWIRCTADAWKTSNPTYGFFAIPDQELWWFRSIHQSMHRLLDSWLVLVGRDFPYINLHTAFFGTIVLHLYFGWLLSYRYFLWILEFCIFVLIFSSHRYFLWNLAIRTDLFVTLLRERFRSVILLCRRWQTKGLVEWQGGS